MLAHLNFLYIVLFVLITCMIMHPLPLAEHCKKFIRHLENTNMIHVSVCPVPNLEEFSLSITKLECLTFPTLSDLSVRGRA